MTADQLKEESAKERLITAATELFAIHGIDGTSTRDISKKAGLNISLISYYFAGKEGLYIACIEDFANRASRELGTLLGKVEPDAITKESFCQAMKTLTYGMISLKLKNPSVAILLQREILSGLPYAKEIYQNVFAQMGEKVVGIFKAAQKKGIVRKEINTYVLFLSMIHAIDHFMAASRCSVQFLHNCPSLPKEMDKYADQIYEIFIKGACS